MPLTGTTAVGRRDTGKQGTALVLVWVASVSPVSVRFPGVGHVGSVDQNPQQVNHGLRKVSARQTQPLRKGKSLNRKKRKDELAFRA